MEIRNAEIYVTRNEFYGALVAVWVYILILVFSTQEIATWIQWLIPGIALGMVLVYTVKILFLRHV
jgi:hypothetical protein